MADDVSRTKRIPAQPRVIDLDERRARHPASVRLFPDDDGLFRIESSELAALGITLRGEFGADNRGRQRIQRIEASAAAGVTTNMLRILPLAEAELAFERTVDGFRRLGRAMVEQARAELVDLLAGLSDADYRRGLPSRFYELVAAIYLSEVAGGVRNPSASLAALTGVPVRTVRGWVRRARDRELLPPAKRGAAG